MSTTPGAGQGLRRPAGVLLIEILLYLGALFQVAAGVAVMIVAAVSDVAPDLETFEIILSTFLILVGMFDAVLARSIGQGHEWARVVYVALQLLVILGGTVAIVQGYPRGVIFFFLPFVLIFLLFTPSSERYFDARR